MARLLDLADYRLLRAVRAGQIGAFPTLWNAHAGSVWSVARGLCATDTEALGWVSSFRVAFEGEVSRLDPDAPAAPQVGLALLRHLEPAFVADGPLPTEVPGAPALGAIPPRPRLLYLVTLFFDLGEEELAAVAGPEGVPRLRAVVRLVEPVEDTGAHDAVHATLLRAAPKEALVLPPGSEPPPRPSRAPWLVAALFALLVGTTSVFVRNLVFPTTWDDFAAEHAATLASQGMLLDSDAAALAGRLSAAGVPSTLAEVPPIAGLQLLGARLLPTSPPEVVMVYSTASELWTLQHRLRPLPELRDVALEADSPAGRLAVVTTGHAPVVAWRESDTLWVLSASVPPTRLMEVALAFVKQREANADLSRLEE